MKIVFCTGSLETIPSNPPKPNLTERFVSKALELNKTAVLNGELDTQIEAAANKLRDGFAQ
jgi:hypothetical protein